MIINRREFLASFGAMYIASLIFSNPVFARVVFNPAVLLDRSECETRIKQWFYLHNTDATHQSNLQLISVEDAGSNSQVNQFALTLRSGRAALAMPSGYYEVAGQPFSLFIKHTHEFAGRHYYRAEFALLR